MGCDKFTLLKQNKTLKKNSNTAVSILISNSATFRVRSNGKLTVPTNKLACIIFMGEVPEISNT